MLGIVLLLFYKLLMNQYQDSEHTSSSCDYHISMLISWNKSLENTKWCGTYSLSLCLCIPWCIQVTIVYIMLKLRDLINVSHCENVTKTFQYFYILLPTLHQVTYCIRYVYFSSNIELLVLLWQYDSVEFGYIINFKHLKFWNLSTSLRVRILQLLLWPAEKSKGLSAHKNRKCKKRGGEKTLNFPTHHGIHSGLLQLKQLSKI